MNLPINQIIHGDCLEVMKGLPDECIDLTVTSPPYDNLRDYNNEVTWNFEKFKEIAKELFRITKPGGVVVWVVGDATINGSEIGTSFRQALYFKDVCGFKLHDTMIYLKNGASFPAGKNSNRYSQVFEYMFVFSKGKPRTANLLKDKPNKWAGSSTFGVSSNRQKDGRIKKGSKRTVGEFGYRTNVWEIPNGKGYSASDDIAYEHPAIFPEALAEGHILTWSNEGDIVLDPMCGSGTTCKMAKQLGRNFIGIDISEEYCEIARKRIAKYTQQLSIESCS